MRSWVNPHIPYGEMELHAICQDSSSQTVTFEKAIADCRVSPILTVAGNILSYHDGRVYSAAEGQRKTEEINYWTFGDGTSASQFSETHKSPKEGDELGNGTHTYKKPGKYLVTLHTGSFTNPLLGDMEGKAVCLGMSYDSLLNTYIPCYYGAICRGKYSFWIEIKGDSISDPLCDFDLQIEQYGQTLKGSIAGQPYLAIYAKDYFWNFGDGSDTVGYSATHQYTKPGRYLVSATTITYSLPLKEVCRETKTQWVEIKNLIMNLSPNPMENSGTISIENAGQLVEFNIYNHSGSLVKSFKGLDNGKLDFPTNDLPIGIYLYTVESGGELVKKDKFSVMR